MDRGFLQEIIRSAIISIKANKLRSILTTLGIIIGVTTVIAVVSTIQGINKKVSSTFSSLGADVIYIQKFPWVMGGPQTRPGGWRRYWSRKDITLNEFNYLKTHCSSIEFITPSISYRTTLKNKDKTVEDVEITGTGSELPKINQQDVEFGRFFTVDDVQFRRAVCVVGKDIVKNLFPNEEVLGKTLVINGLRCLIIGILEEKGNVMGRSMDNVVAIPHTTFQKIFGYNRSFSILILSKDKENAIEEIRFLLRNYRHVKEGEEDDFAINTSDALLKGWNELTRTIFLVMIGIASVALIVGGIGIMNIMLVSVTERTREIGIRKAIGAKKTEVLLQFLTEAIIISLVGGILGIMIGVLVFLIVSGIANLPFSIPFWIVILGFVFSSIVGIFFGFYPAKVASELNPVEALRYE